MIQQEQDALPEKAVVIEKSQPERPDTPEVPVDPLPVQKSETPSDSYLPEQKSLSMLEDDQKRVRAALGMDITEDDDPSNDNYE